MDELESTIVYRNPRENIDLDEDPFHTFDLMDINGNLMGKAEVSYFSKPFPLYQINDLYVEVDYQGEGNAGKIMSAVESFLKERGKAGVLVDAIDEDSPASGLYERRGWSQVPNNLGIHAFNLPKEARLEQLIGYANRQTDLMSRPGWMKNNLK